MSTKAVFLDRDGTLIRNHHYGCDPAQIEFLAGVPEGMRLLQDEGYALILVTNQSGIARGYFDEFQLAEMHRQLRYLLAKEEVILDAVYFCPHHPQGNVAGYARHCECRKPKPGMILRAGLDHAIDLGASWLVGDILDDVEAGNAAGCQTVLIDNGTEGQPQTALRVPTFYAKDFLQAVRLILGERREGPTWLGEFAPESSAWSVAW